MEQMDKIFRGSSKQRARLISTGSTWNPNNQSLTQNQSINNVSTKNLGNSPVTSTKFQTNSMKNVSGMGLSNPNVSGTQQRRSVYQSSQSQIQNVVLWRQFCIYYHYYTVELYTNLPVIRYQLGSIESYGQLLLILAMLVKSKSTYCLSLVSLHNK